MACGKWAWTLLTLAANAARNRTVLAPNDDRYDVGAYTNLRQIFGERMLLWLLPLPGTETRFDGLDFPLNPNPREQTTEEQAANLEEAAINDPQVRHYVKPFRRGQRRHED